MEGQWHMDVRMPCKKVRGSILYGEAGELSMSASFKTRFLFGNFLPLQIGKRANADLSGSNAAFCQGFENGALSIPYGGAGKESRRMGNGCAWFLLE